MSDRSDMAVRVCVVVVASSMVTPVAGLAQTTGDADAPRTAWGAPDLQGVWDFRTLTPFERPTELGEKDVLTDEERAEFEASRLAEFAVRDDQKPADIVGNYNQFWFDPGTTAVETNRKSLVIESSDGRVPMLTPAEATRQAEVERIRRGLLMHDITPGGWVEDMGSNALQVRCIVGFNSGPPMTPGGYNQNVQLFQTEDHVVLLNEMVHNARIIPLDSRGHLDQDIRQWTGDSRGHWDGDTFGYPDDQLPSRNRFSEWVDRCELASDGAVHTGVDADIDVRSDNRRPDCLVELLGVSDPDAEKRPAVV